MPEGKRASAATGSLQQRLRVDEHGFCSRLGCIPVSTGSTCLHLLAVSPPRPPAPLASSICLGVGSPTHCDKPGWAQDTRFGGSLTLFLQSLRTRLSRPFLSNSMPRLSRGETPAISRTMSRTSFTCLPSFCRAQHRQTRLSDGAQSARDHRHHSTEPWPTAPPTALPHARSQSRMSSRSRARLAPACSSSLRASLLRGAPAGLPWPHAGCGSRSASPPRAGCCAPGSRGQPAQRGAGPAHTASVPSESSRRSRVCAAPARHAHGRRRGAATVLSAPARMH